MCGVFGWVLPVDRAQDPQLLQDLTGLMAHRGPDGSGHWVGMTADRRHQVALGHRRLSIIDISGGAQPMWSADGTIAATFNGEIYNYIELRNELRSRGHVFRTSSDTEVLIAAYREFGADAVNHFRGMFAFALWDANRQIILLARDQFGKKPMFIRTDRGSLLFASEVNPLLRFPGLDQGFDWEALGNYLLYRYVPGPATFFRGVRKLPPGCRAVWANGRLSIDQYFTPPLRDRSPDIRSFGDAVRMFDSTFDGAVHIRMRSDASFGAFLSGGIDSSAVVAAMARHSPSKIRTFSVGYPEAKYSELAYARAVAEIFGAEHHELIVTPDALAEVWPEAVLRRGAPVSQPSDLPILLLSKAASRSVKMVLTGEGSDEFFAGYPKHAAERWIQTYQRLVPALVHDHLVWPAVKRLPFQAHRLKMLAKAAGERQFANRMPVWFGGLSVAERDAIMRRHDQIRSVDPFPVALDQAALRQILLFDQTSWLPDNLLERGDRMMMAGSIEGRMPFMDVELARLAARLPDRFLVQRLYGKAVVRGALARVLPQPIINRKKMGFPVPVADWFRNAHRDLLVDLLRSRASETRRLCQPAMLDQLIDEHMYGKQNHEKTLWCLANLELFVRTFRREMSNQRKPKSAIYATSH
jgi:asparagine synthase (glutamine-hydrolysing)